MLRALRYRNYRLFFGGQIVSIDRVVDHHHGDQLARLSAHRLGAAPGRRRLRLAVPVVPAHPVRRNLRRSLEPPSPAGRHADGVDGRSRSCSRGLTLSSTISIPWLIAVSVCQGVVNAFDMPGRQAFVVTLIEDKKDLGNAIALNSSMFNAARLVGPSVAGALIAVSNEGWCYFIDGVSYLSVIAALLAMRISASPRRAPTREGPLAQFREGWHYAYNSRPIRSVIALIALTCLVGVPYTVLMPVFAAEILGGGAHTLGFLMTASGGGALLGALWLASRRTTTSLGRNIPVAGAIFSCGLIAFAFSHVLWLSVVLLVVAGFGFMVQIASSNTLLQTIVEDTKRGRVMAFFLMAYFGTTPFGSLVAGAASARIGAPLTLAIGGALCLMGVTWFATTLPSLHRDIHPIFARLGVTPPPVDQSA